jgi:hypothetical protein
MTVALGLVLAVIAAGDPLGARVKGNVAAAIFASVLILFVALILGAGLGK